MRPNPYYEITLPATNPELRRTALVWLSMLAALAVPIVVSVLVACPRTAGRAQAHLTTKDGTHTALARGTCTLTEKVSLPRDVEDGPCEAHVELRLMDGDGTDLGPIAAPDGGTDHHVRATAKDGTLEVPLTIDANELAGRTVSARVRVVRDGQVVFDSGNGMAHEQSVRFPRLLADVREDEVASSVNSTVHATLTCENLEPGDAYELAATLVDCATGEQVDGKGATVTAPLDSAGTKATSEVSLTLERGQALGSGVRVEATLRAAGTTVGSIVDNEAPLVRVPAIEAGPATTSTSADGTIMATRTVSCKGLVPGRAYVLTSTMCEKDREDVTETVEIVPDDTTAVAQVTFDLGTDKPENREVGFADSLSRASDEHVLAAFGDTAERTILPTVFVTASGAHTRADIEPASTDAGIAVEISYKGLEQDADYTCETTLALISETGEELGRVSPSASDIAPLPFTAEGSTGSVALSCPLDASGLAGSSVRPTVRILSGDALVAQATGCDVAIPAVTVVATDAATGLHEALATADLVIDANVALGNAPIASGLAVSVTIADAVTGNAVTGPDGSPATVRHEVAITNDTQTVAIAVPVDASDLAGTELVAIATVEADGHAVATTSDTWSEASRVHIPALTCTLADAETGLSVARHGTETTLAATVAVGGLEQGMAHRVEIELVDADTGEPITDHAGVPASRVVAIGSDYPLQTAEATLAIDTTRISGRTVALRASLTTGGIVTASSETSGATPTVRVARIGIARTHDAAHGSVSGTRSLEVSWENLEPRLEYTLCASRGTDLGNATFVAHETSGVTAVPLTDVADGFSPTDEVPTARLSLAGTVVALTEGTVDESPAVATPTSPKGLTDGTTSGASGTTRTQTPDAGGTPKATPDTSDAGHLIGLRLLLRVVAGTGIALVTTGALALAGMRRNGAA